MNNIFVQSLLYQFDSSVQSAKGKKILHAGKFAANHTFSCTAEILERCFASFSETCKIKMLIMQLHKWSQARTLAGAKCATVQGLQNYRASKFTQYTKFLDDRKLLSSCVNLEVKLKSERSDIDGRDYTWS